jgi:hypothetical protein
MNIQDIKSKLRGTEYISEDELDFYVKEILKDHDKLEDLVISMQDDIEYYQSFGLKGEK